MELGTKNPLKLKAILLSNDGGKTWIVSRQYFLVDLREDQFRNESLQGQTLVIKTEDGDHVR